MKKGNLYLLPTQLGDTRPEEELSKKVFDVASSTTHFLVEDLRSARRFLKKLNVPTPISELHFTELSEHQTLNEIPNALDPCLEGKNMCIISEAGLPGVADPGSDAVFLAHLKGIRVIPISGPSSIFMALMSAGFSGQQFTFHGYLPKEKGDRVKALKKMENETASGYTQLFMETPYRNNQLFNDIVQTCKPTTWVSVAANITMDNEFIRTKTIRDWQKNLPDLHKKPCIFSIGLPSN